MTAPRPTEGASLALPALPHDDRLWHFSICQPAPKMSGCRSRACPTGKSKRAAREALSSPLAKNIPFLDSPKSVLELAPSRSVRGALAIVTNVERDAVDVDALLTNLS